MRRLMVVLYVLPLVGGLAATMWRASDLITAMRMTSVLAAVLPGIALVLLMKFTNRHLQLPWAHVLALFAWGFFTVGAYATVIAVDGESLLVSLFHISHRKASDAVIGLVGPMVEEASKALGVLWAFVFLPRRAWPVAAFVYASLIGIGFATYENITHFNSNGATVEMFRARGPGYFSHPLYTSVTAAMLGLVWADQRKWLPPLMGMLGWLLASGIHMMSNVNNISDVDAVHLRDFTPVLWLALLFVVGKLSHVGATSPEASSG